MAACEDINSWQLLRVSTPEKRRGDEVIAADASPPRVKLNCEYGDPTMFEAYWDVHKNEHVMVSSANESLSYFVKSKKHQGSGPIIWFVNADLDDAVRELHALVGNAVTQDKVIVVGTGSTQLFQAAMFALASRNGTSTPVVAQSPYYTGYPQTIDFLQSKLFHWAGDSNAFQPKGGEEFVEVVTSPNNPCGEIREGLLAGEDNGVLVHDLAYYWPTYTPITKALDHDVMLFTLSKCTGHAGLRIGWAIVKDPEVAKKMAEFIVVSTIGTSQDAQCRAAGIMRTVVKGYNVVESVSDHGVKLSLDRKRWTSFMWGKAGVVDSTLAKGKLFHWSKAVMERRWARVRHALAANKRFSIREPPPPTNCTFLGVLSSPCPAFIWLKCEEEADCLAILQRNGILARGGTHFGVSAQYARVSLLASERDADLLLKRLTTLT